jgi:hypothetical protein
MIRRGRADHDHVELRGIDACGFKRAQGGLVAKVAGGFAFGRDVPLTNSGARLDPLIRGFDHFSRSALVRTFSGK